MNPVTEHCEQKLFGSKKMRQDTVKTCLRQFMTLHVAARQPPSTGCAGCSAHGLAALNHAWRICMPPRTSRLRHLLWLSTVRVLLQKRPRIGSPTQRGTLPRQITPPGQPRARNESIRMVQDWRIVLEVCNKTLCMVPTWHHSRNMEPRCRASGNCSTAHVQEDTEFHTCCSFFVEKNELGAKKPHEWPCTQRFVNDFFATSVSVRGMNPHSAQSEF